MRCFTWLMVFEDIDFRTVEQQNAPKQSVATMCGDSHNEKAGDQLEESTANENSTELNSNNVGRKMF